MSLDVWLTGESHEVECICSCCENKHTRIQIDTLYSANITHNLSRMAEAAGVYQALWRPEEIGIKKAHQLTPFLKDGIAAMESNPSLFKQFDAPNEWGTYDDFLPWCRAYLQACEEYPNADVGIWR